MELFVINAIMNKLSKMEFVRMNVTKVIMPIRTKCVHLVGIKIA